MTSAAAASGEPATPPTLDRSKGSYGASEFGAVSGDSSSNVDRGFTAARAHGLLLGLAFMILFPSGAVVLSTWYDKALRAHVALQLAASLTAFAGVAVIAWPILSNGGVSHLDRRPRD